MDVGLRPTALPELPKIMRICVSLAKWGSAAIPGFLDAQKKAEILKGAISY
jgi:hypothetical protein